MEINEEEMEGILEMYRFVEGEGQESTSMYYLVKRIKKEKRKEGEYNDTETMV